MRLAQHEGDIIHFEKNILEASAGLALNLVSNTPNGRLCSSLLNLPECYEATLPSVKQFPIIPPGTFHLTLR